MKKVINISSFLNYSKKSRGVLDSDYNLNPQNKESRNTNNNQKEGFNKVRDKWTMLCSYFRRYPDHFIDFIQTDDPKINLLFYQRIYLRIIFRYRKVFITATRGTSKSFTMNLAFVLLCIMYPNNKLFITAPGKQQAAKITQECLDDIFDFFPLLRFEVKKYTDNKDYTKLVFYNGSKYDVVQMKDSSRGGRRFGGGIEEIADKKFDGDILNSVVIPLMAGNRLSTKNGKIDPNEIHKREIYITTAGTKQQFAYEKCSEIMTDMLNRKSSFCIGNSYELPVMFDRLDEDFIEEKRESPTYSILDFMREYESIYTGSNSDSLVSDEKLRKSRVVKYAEWEHCGDKDVDYVLAYDVSRNQGDENALCALVVIKITRDGNKYIKEVVNIFSLEGQHDTWQAKFLKDKVREFQSKILVIDANGLGSGVVDQLVLDLDDGNPPYKVVNDKKLQWRKYELPEGIPMVFALKSSNVDTKNSDMINHFMKLFNKLDVGLLVSPYEGLKYLEKKRKRKFSKDDSEEQVIAEIPYVNTNNLVDEIMNLRYKAKGNNTEVERISRSIQKDKYSALLYGLYWIFLEEQKLRIRKSAVDISKFKSCATAVSF